MRREETLRRYPMLLRALRWVLIGTQSEAASTIECYKQGVMMGCEACSHSGLTTKDRILHAFRSRHIVRRQHATELV